MSDSEARQDRIPFIKIWEKDPSDQGYTPHISVCKDGSSVEIHAKGKVVRKPVEDWVDMAWMSGEEFRDKTMVEHQLWRAGQALERARALRMMGSFILLCTAVYSILFSDTILERAAAIIMFGLCARAISIEA